MYIFDPVTDRLAVFYRLAVAADGSEPVQMKLYKSLRLWTFYVDLEESLGNMESTREVYERILDLRIATPQIIINYALLLEVCLFFLFPCPCILPEIFALNYFFHWIDQIKILLFQEHKYFEDAFKVYERGVKIFKYPHVKDIWVTYLSKFVKRYGKTKLERARELFEHAVDTVRTPYFITLSLSFCQECPLACCSVIMLSRCYIVSFEKRKRERE